MKTSAKKILNIARISFASIVLLLISISVLCIYRFQDLKESRMKVSNLQKLVELQEHVISASKDFVIAARGYYIIKDPTYIQPFERGKSVYRSHMKKLDTLYQEFHLDTLGKLKGMIQRRLDYTIKIIDKTRIGQSDSAVITIKKANPIIDSISKQSDKVRVDVHNQIASQIFINTEKFKTVTTLVVILGIIVFIILMTVFFLLKYDISGRVKAEQELQDKNQELQHAYEDLETKITFRSLDLEREILALKQRINELEKK